MLKDCPLDMHSAPNVEGKTQLQMIDSLIVELWPRITPNGLYPRLDILDRVITLLEERRRLIQG